MNSVSYGDLPYLASLINAQSSVFSRHANEHKYSPHVGDVAMMLSDIGSIRRTLDDAEKKINEEIKAAGKGNN